jgi:uncharacterized protein YqgQ
MNKMKTYYRVDEYTKNFGTLLFISTYKPQYAGIMSHEQAHEIYGGNYIQVTKFVAPADIAMMSFEQTIKEAWEQGEIVKTSYFMPQ